MLLDDISAMANMKIGGRERKTVFDFLDVKGKTFKLTISGLGDELDFSGIEKLNGIVKLPRGRERKIPLKMYFRDIFLDLPEKPVQVSEAWEIEKTAKTKTVTGIESNHQYTMRSKLEGIEKRNNANCLKIKITSKGTLNGHRKAGINNPDIPEIVIKAKTDTSGYAYFDHANGLLLEVDLKIIT